MTRLALTLALLLTLAGCAALPAPDTPTPAERTVIVEGPSPTPAERTVVVERTIVKPSPSPAIRTVYLNRTVTVERTVVVTPTATPTATRTATPEPTFADGVEIDWYVFRQNVSADPEGSDTMYELLVDVENHNDANATVGLYAAVNYTDGDGDRRTLLLFSGRDRWTVPAETEVRVRRAYVWPRHIPDATVSVELYDVKREGDEE